MKSLSIHCGAHWPRIDSNPISEDLNPRRLSLLNGVWPLSGGSWEAWWVRGAMGLVKRSTWQVWLLANRDQIQLFIVIHIFSKQMKKADPKTVLPFLNAVWNITCYLTSHFFPIFVFSEVMMEIIWNSLDSRDYSSSIWVCVEIILDEGIFFWNKVFTHEGAEAESSKALLLRDNKQKPKHPRFDPQPGQS